MIVRFVLWSLADSDTTIAKDPDVVEVFDAEATVSVVDQLSHRGLAFDS